MTAFMATSVRTNPTKTDMSKRNIKNLASFWALAAYILDACRKRGVLALRAEEPAFGKLAEVLQ
jgi:hypothetical protein